MTATEIERGAKEETDYFINEDRIELQATRKRKRVTFAASTFAATSQTEEEAKNAEKGHADGSKPVVVAKRVWRPKVRNEYVEPEEILDTSGDVDWLFEECGRVVVQQKKTLPPRNDVIVYSEEQHGKELKANMQWRDCPEWVRPIIHKLLVSEWDVFVKEGMKRGIRGYEFQIDTGDAKPISCKVPVFGPHESRVIMNLVAQLEAKGLIEKDEGPWGSPIVLASKPNQGHKHWSEYVFRLCVSYRALNAITRPFLFPVRRCDEAIEMVGPAKFVITMDLDAGYWQMMLRPGSRAKTAFYIPGGKRRWKVTPMGATNAHPAFVAMAMEMEELWNEEYETTRKDSNDKKAKALISWMQEAYDQRRQEGKGNDNAKQKTELTDDEKWNPMEEEPKWAHPEEPTPKSAVIVDDIILAAVHASTLLFYFLSVLSILKHHRITVNLRKSRFIPKRAEFVGVDVLPSGNSPAQLKNKAIKNIQRPILFTDLRLLIGLLGFYRNWIPLYETRIAPWRKILKKQPKTGQMSKEEEAEELTKLWEENERSKKPKFIESGDTNEELLEAMKQEILDGPVLKRPDPNRRFYLKSDWSCMAQGAVLLQADSTQAAEEATLKEIWGHVKRSTGIKRSTSRRIDFIF